MERRRLFGVQSRHWSPQENEFIAENELITVTPNFNCSQMHFISGSYGPFRAQISINIPIWLAIQLHKSKKCKILIPQWLNENNLKEMIKKEQDSNSNEFTDISFFYREIAKILLSNEIIDPQTSNNIRILIKDLEEVRSSKMLSGIKQIEPDSYSVGMNNISAYEISCIRHTVLKTLNCYFDINLSNNKNNLTQSQTQESLSQSQILTNSDINSNINNSSINSSSSNNIRERRIKRSSVIDDEKSESPFHSSNINTPSTIHSNIDDALESGRNVRSHQRNLRNNNSNRNKYNNNNNSNNNNNNNSNNDEPPGYPTRKLRRLRR